VYAEASLRLLELVLDEAAPRFDATPATPSPLLDLLVEVVVASCLLELTSHLTGRTGWLAGGLVVVWVVVTVGLVGGGVLAMAARVFVVTVLAPAPSLSTCNGIDKATALPDTHSY